MNYRISNILLITCLALGGVLCADSSAVNPVIHPTAWPNARIGLPFGTIAFAAPTSGNSSSPAAAAPNAAMLPPTAAPLPPTTSTLIQAPEKRWIPPAIVIRNPQFLPVDRPAPASPRASADSPPVASLTAPPPWAPRLLPVGPAPRGDLPDSAKPPAMVTRARQAPHVLPPTDDPTAQQSEQLSVQVIDKFPRSPAAFLKLAIPDPFPAAADLKLAQPPPDQDRPAPTFVSPTRPKKLP